MYAPGVTSEGLYAELLTEYGRQVGWSTGHLLNLADECRSLRKHLKAAEDWTEARVRHERIAIRRRTARFI